MPINILRRDLSRRLSYTTATIRLFRRRVCSSSSDDADDRYFATPNPATVMAAAVEDAATKDWKDYRLEPVQRTPTDNDQQKQQPTPRPVDVVLHSQFEKELYQSDFRIFKPLEDHGYWTWKPNTGDYKNMNDLTLQDWTDCIIPHSTPIPLRSNLDDIAYPHSFVGEKQNTTNDSMNAESAALPPPLPKPERRFPYQKFNLAALHVAVRYRNLDTSSIDFVFCDNALHCLATRVANPKFTVTKVQGTILMVRGDDIRGRTYRADTQTRNRDFGIYFERFMQQQQPSSLDIGQAEPSVWHLHTMEVGLRHRVLFSVPNHIVLEDSNGDDNKATATATALTPVALDGSPGRSWSLRILTRMLSCAAPVLCHGVRAPHQRLQRIDTHRLSAVAEKAFAFKSKKVIETSVMRSLDGLKELLADAKEGEFFKMGFSKGYVRLEACYNPKEDETILPPQDVVKALLS